MASMMVWNQVLQLNCLDHSALPAIPDQSVDLILADLPYGITQNEWDSTIDLPSLWHEWLRILIPQGVIVLFAKQPFTTTLITSQPTLFRDELIWVKEKGTCFFDVHRRPLPMHENILIFSPSKQYTYFPQKALGDPYEKTRLSDDRSTNYGRDVHSSITTKNEGTREPVSVLWCPRDHANVGIHPTQKPLALCQWLIRSYSHAGGNVVDPCVGSGSTILACIAEGRNYMGYEIDPDIYTIMKKRVQRFANSGRDDVKKPPKPDPRQRSLLDVASKKPIRN